MPGSIAQTDNVSPLSGKSHVFQASQGSGARASAAPIGVAQTLFAGQTPMIQRFLPSTTSAGTYTAGNSVSVTVGSTANMFAGQLCLVDSAGTNPEWAEVASVTSATVVVFSKLLSAHDGSSSAFTVLPYSCDPLAWAPGAPGVACVSSDGLKPTYRAGGNGLTLYSTAAAVLLEVVGSATKTIRVKKIEIWGQAATKFFTELQLLRCTGASAGTPAVAVKGKHDKNDANATAVINSYAAAAAAGAGSAVIGAKVLNVGAPAATLPALSAVWDFCRNEDKALILRGTGDVIEVYNTITGLGAGTFGFEVEWEEDAS